MSYISDFPLFRSVVIKLLNLIVFSVLAAYSPASIADSETNYKSLRSYSKTLDSIERKLERHRYDENELSQAIKQVAEIESAGSQCIVEESATAEELKKNLESLGKPNKNELVNVRQKRKELNHDILKAQEVLASCRVIVLRGEEVLKGLSVEQQNLLSVRLFAKTDNISDLILKNWNKPSLWLKATQLFLLNNTGIALISITNMLVLLVVIFFSLLISLLIRKHICRYIRKNMMHDTFSNHILRSFLSISAFYAPHLLISLSVAVFCYILTSTVTPVPFISVIAYGLPIYFTLIAIVEIFLRPRKPAISFHGLPETVAIALAQRLKVFLILLFIGYLLFTTLLTQSLPKETLLLSRGLFTFIFVLNLIWAVQLLGKIPRFENTIFIRFAINLILISILVVELLGYRNLSAYVIFAVFGTLFTFGIFIILSRLLNDLFDGLIKGKARWQRYIRNSLGIKVRKKLPELNWIRLIFNTALWLILIAAVLRIWGLSDTGFQQINTVLMEGFTIGSLKIIPARIILAVIVLTALLALNSWLKTNLESSWLLRTNFDRGAREAVATISGYVGVALALIISLSVTGVEFGNMAIIAGALSVGIGFGLQNIVNNFVSGLIILFERPIKTGDWIVVGSTEGFVKRISIRSTQIQTFDQADVIVPNSDLISGQVTNWMLRDVTGRIRVPVGVAYGTDTLLVHNILMDIAQKNALVVTDGSVPEPKVLFMGFGDSSLLFELRVFIKNIPQKFQANSDLNFAIDAAFREHNIQIPFPQRDVHIKNAPENDTGLSNENASAKDINLSKDND